MADLVKLAGNLETRRVEDDGCVLYDVIYAGREVGFIARDAKPDPGSIDFKYLRSYEAWVNHPTKGRGGSVVIGMFDPQDYKSHHAARKAAAESIVVAYDKLIDGEVL
jgi:hypothetical protein